MNWSQLLFSFEGRVGRATYWYYALAMIVIFGILGAFGGMSMMSGMQASGGAPPNAGVMGIVFPLVCLATLWPSLAIAAKRWHDVDKSAWWILIALVPAVGGIIALVFNGFIAGTPGPNQYGNPPN
jgi:uncharacterized membrane protein YhaH (DUF805 family)